MNRKKNAIMKKYGVFIKRLSACCLFALLALKGFSVQPNVIPGLIAGDQTVDFLTTPEDLKNTLFPDYGGVEGPWTVVWESSVDKIQWNQIVGATELNYSFHEPLVRTTYFRRLVVRQTDGWKTMTNTVCITVNPLFPGTIADDQSVEPNKAPDIIKNVVSPITLDGSYRVRWEIAFHSMGPWSQLKDTTLTLAPRPADRFNVYYRRAAIHIPSSYIAYSNIVCVSPDWGTMTPGKIAGDQEISEGTQPTMLQNVQSPSVTNESGFKLCWEYSWSKYGPWKRSNVGTITCKPPVLRRTTYFRREIERIADGTKMYSNTVCVKVLPIMAVWSGTYILTQMPLIGTVAVDNLSLLQCRSKIQYFDGLGRPSQTVQFGFCPDYQDLISLTEYDELGRESEVWLPASYASKGGDLSADVAKVYSRITNLNDPQPYSSTVYDGSPISRVTEQYGPGKDFSRAPVKTGYRTNLATGNPDLICAKYVVKNNQLTKTGVYPANSLYVTETTDEDGHVSYQFKDKTGLLLLERKVGGMSRFDTYYVYDELLNLRYVLPPLASDGLSAVASWNDNNAVLSDYAYLYRYDKRGRCTQKKLPGVDWMHMVYDKSDRLIFTQDGNQRGREWTFSIPDALGRVVLTGVCGKCDGAVISIGCLDNKTVTATYRNGQAATPLESYTLNCTLDSPSVLTAYYYDSYDFLNNFTGGVCSELQYSNSFESKGYGKWSRDGNCKGLQTGKVCAFDISSTQLVSEGYTYEAIYYDNRKRTLQTVKRNHMDGLSLLAYKYDFTGNVLEQTESHEVPRYSCTDVLVRKFTYDHAGRKTGESSTLNDGEPAVVYYTYNELGRLTGKQYGVEGGENAVERLSYNIRGWLSEQSGCNFVSKLYYNDCPFPALGYDVSHSGNIVGWSCNYGGGDEQTYLFSYDGLSRLKYASLLINGARSNAFDENVRYDKNGNITWLSRYSDGKSTDNLTCTYKGNQLVSLGTPETGFGYDSNGNMTRYGDGYGGECTIAYNRLNQPTEITYADSRQDFFNYAADGEHIYTCSTIQYNPQFDYLGSFVYLYDEQGYSGLESVAFGEGRFKCEPNSSTEIEYYVKDHLGSVRVVQDERASASSMNDYYPLGGRWTSPELSAATTRYLFNGKERQPIDGLDLLDYGARMYHPRLGRWLSVDPQAEKYYSQTPYGFCGGNPVRNVDPMGNDWYSVSGGGIQYDPNVTSNSVLAEGQTYLGQSYQQKGRDGSVITDYRSDGSIYYTQESAAYSRMVSQTSRTGNETMSVLTDKGVLMLPEYKNTAHSVDMNDYGYTSRNGNIVDSYGKEHKTLGTVHTHPDGSTPSTWTGNGYGDLGFAATQTPYKPVYVMQMAGKNKISLVVSAHGSGGSYNRYAIEHVTNSNPDATITNLIKGNWGLIPYTKNIDFHNGW